MQDYSAKAGYPCSRCGGQVMPRWETDMESRRGLEDTCVQCGFQPHIHRPTSKELAMLRRESYAERFRGMPRGEAAEPEGFLCKRPGCGKWKVRHDVGGGYCSHRCWYLHRPEVTAKPKKSFWKGVQC